MTTLGVKVASNSLLPPDVGGTFNQASWTAGAADALANGIIQQAFANNGDTSKIGMPASWPYGPIPSGAVRADGTISPLLWSQIQGYVNSSAAQSDTDFGGWLGVQYSQAAPGGIQDAPLTAAEQLARDQFEFQKTQAILKQIGGAVGSTSSSVPRSSSTRSLGGASGSGGNSGSSGSDLEAQRAADAQSLATYQAKRDIDLAYQQALNALQNDPNNPELAYKAAQLAETKRQFDEQMAYQRERDAKSLGLDTAKIIADYSANPGDAVAREYFLRGQAQPVGNAVNIFSGQPTGQQMTFSQLMQANAPLVGQALNSSLTGQPVEAQQNAQQGQSDTPAQQEDRTPAYAYGTERPAEITPDGWTRSNQFITGDHPMGMPNPELNQVRVRNGRAETKVTPLSKMMRGHSRMPMYADGTDTSMAAADPFFGTGFQGMDPNAVVTNGNSQYYGMTAQQAFDAMNAHNRALTAYNPKSLDALGQVTGYAPAYVVGPTADTPGMYFANGQPRDTINVANQADAGILTGAQMSKGATQSANPGLPGYVRPADLPPLPGSGQMGVTTSTDTTQGGTQTDSVKPATTTTAGAAGGPTNEPKASPADGITAPTTTGIKLGAADAGGNQLVMGPGTFSKDGATWQLQSGDYRRPDGTWVRYDPVRKEYMPIQPNYTPITSEAEFWALPADVQQKIFTGQPTGYALLGGWRSGLLAGQYLTRQDLGPMMGTTDGLLRLPMGGPTSAPIDYSPAMSPEELDNLYSSFTQESGVAPNTGTVMKPWDVLTTPVEEKPGSNWQIYTTKPDIPTGPGLHANPATAGWKPTTLAIGPDGTAYIGKDGIWTKTGDWHTALTGTASPLTSPDQLSSWLAENRYAPDNSYAPVQPATSGTTGGPATTGGATGATGGTTGIDRGGSDPVTGTAGGTGGGSTTSTGSSAGSGSGAGGATGGTVQGNPLAQALAQLLGLSYGSGAYQNLPSLLFAGGGDAGQYDTVSNQPIEVPGLGITLPSASQMMNYEMLNKLQQNGSFDLLNSLYTAGNVPLSILLKMAEARAPRGSAYEPGLVSTV